MLSNWLLRWRSTSAECALLWLLQSGLVHKAQAL